MAFILGVSGRPYAEATRARIDTEVARLLREIEQRTLDLFTTHRCPLDQLAELLLEQETVDGSVVYRLIEAATVTAARSGGRSGTSSRETAAR